jgi:hypothetical protein
VYLDDNAKTFTSWDDIEDLESYSPNKINIIIPMA